MNYVERVLARLKGGDEAKIAKVNKYSTKFVKDQIKALNEENNEFEDKLEEIKEEITEYVESPDLDVKGVDGVKTYVSGEYITGINDLISSRKSIEKEIESNKDQIKRYEEILGLLG